MKRFSALILVGVAFALGAMIFLHRQSVSRADALQARIELLQEREAPLRDMTVSIEKYRRMSAHFRKMTPVEMDQAKDSLRRSVVSGLGLLEKLDATPEELTEIEGIRKHLDAMIEFAVRFERTAYNKDAYQKAEMVAFHDDIASSLKSLDEETQTRIQAIEAQTHHLSDKTTPILLALGGLVIALFLVNSVREYLLTERPLRRMHDYAVSLRRGTLDFQKVIPFKGRFGDVQSALAQLTQMVQGHARERHKFILDVVSDLRSPLTMLMEGKHLLGRSAPAIADDAELAEEMRALDSVRRGIAMLSGSLEDMEDIVEYARLDSRMEENLVDLSALVGEVARSLNAGPGMEKQITTTVPPMPIWVHVDARRVERALMQIITKVASTLHQGTAIHVSLEQPNRGSFRGVEIVVQDTERSRDQGIRASSTGPEVDVLKHWISEKGLGMTLSHRVVKALGGTLTASGMPGTSVQLSLRLPQDRIAQVGLISAPRGLEVKLGAFTQQSRNAELPNHFSDDSARI